MYEMHRIALPSKYNTMKIQVTSTNNIVHVHNGSASGSSVISEGDSAVLLGMNRAYNKLKSRIKREGLYSLAFSEHGESRQDQGFITLSRI